MWKAKIHQILPKILEDYPTYRWIRLTLTIRSPDIADLRSTIDHLNKSFNPHSALRKSSIKKA